MYLRACLKISFEFFESKKSNERKELLSALEKEFNRVTQNRSENKHDLHRSLFNNKSNSAFFYTGLEHQFKTKCQNKFEDVKDFFDKDNPGKFYKNYFVKNSVKTNLKKRMKFRLIGIVFEETQNFAFNKKHKASTTQEKIDNKSNFSASIVYHFFPIDWIETHK